jgi:hypothetical protein
MNCRISRRRLSAFIDGDLARSESAGLRRHLEHCSECSRAANQLRRLKLTAAELDEIEPPVDLFQRALVRLDQGAAPRPFLVPAFAGLAVVAAGVVGVAFWTVSSDPIQPDRSSVRMRDPQLAVMSASDAEFDALEEHYRASVSSLRQIAERESVRWSALERARFESNLELFERAVARSREAVELFGPDPRARELHFSAYRQQIRFLQDSILSGVSGSGAGSGPRRGPASRGGRAGAAMPAAWQP